MKKVVLNTMVVLLAGVALLEASADRDRGRRERFRGPRFETDLLGAEEVPPVQTKTSGAFEIRFNSDLTAAKFKLDVADGKDVLMAHLHCGDPGENGPVVVFLWGNVPGGFDVDGTLSEFVISEQNIAAVNADCTNAIGMDIVTMADLAGAMEDGLIYANVHSVAHPGGEVRGQLGDNDNMGDGGGPYDNGNDNGGDHGGHGH